MKPARNVSPSQPALASVLAGLLAGVLAHPLALSACATDRSPEHYRLAGSSLERRSASDPLLRELQAKYPDFFAVVLDPRRTQEPDILEVREDLEEGRGRERYDALNAVAIAYFELNARAQHSLEDDSDGGKYLSDSFRAAKLLSIPWRAYGGVDDPVVRDAILDFLSDVAAGDKPYAAATAPRLERLVWSLRKKESDPTRLARIEALEAKLRAMLAALEARKTVDEGDEEP